MAPAVGIYLILLALVPGECVTSPDGERHCKSPAWLFVAIWTCYFLGEAILRARSIAALPPRADPHASMPAVERLQFAH